MAVEIVVGLCGGVIEPNCLQPREVSSEREGSFLNRYVRNHDGRVSRFLRRVCDGDLLTWRSDDVGGGEVEREEKKRVFVCYIVGEYFGFEDVISILKITKLPQIFLNWISFCIKCYIFIGDLII